MPCSYEMYLDVGVSVGRIKWMITGKEFRLCGQIYDGLPSTYENIHPRNAKTAFLDGWWQLIESS